MGYETIRTAVADGVFTLTLDRPDRLNAFTHEMGREIVAALDDADADDDVRAVVVTGAGRAFCAGADLSSGAGAFEESSTQAAGADWDVPRDPGGEVALRIFGSLKPVIGAINGAAVGIGATMTLPMDVRLVARDARVGFVFARRGIVPEAASSWFLPRIVGISQAMEWVATGRIFDADEACRGGLARSVHEPQDLLDAAHALAREITAETAPVSVALTRQLMWRMLTASHPMQAHRAESIALQQRGRMPDAREGVASFLEKRAAVFTDRVSADLPDIFEGWEEPPFAP
jgi:enoyl-CoA hydratase/carnithine racemase